MGKRNEMKPKEALQLLEEDENLPVLPQLFYQIVDASSNPDTPVPELAKLILEDQVLTGRVLRIANSAYYAMPQKISTVTRAVMVLGFMTLKNFITAVTVVETLSTDQFKGRMFEKFWIHALACGLGAKFFAERLRSDHREEAMIAGLIHDCGKLFLDHHFPKEYKSVLDMTLAGKDVLIAERKAFGLTHLDVGKRIAEKWELPSTLIEAIRNHHQFSKALKKPRLSDLIYLADLLVPKTIPDEWADLVSQVPTSRNGQQAIGTICSESGLSEETVNEIIEMTKDNVQQVASDLNLNFLGRSTRDETCPPPELFRLQREMEKTERQLAMLSEISAFVTENPRPEDLIQLVIEAIHRGIGFNRTLLFLLDTEKDSVAGKFGLGHDVPPFLRQVKVPIRSDGLMGEVIRHKKAFNILDAASQSYSDLPVLEIPSLAEIQTFALVPFLAGTEVIGLVMVDNEVTRETITDRDVDLIRTFLTLAGIYLAGYKK
jgi:HD-like signal output (HDOD) protein